MIRYLDQKQRELILAYGSISIEVNTAVKSWRWQPKASQTYFTQVLEAEEKYRQWDQATGSQCPYDNMAQWHASSSKAPPPIGSITFPNSSITWGPSGQTLGPLGNVCHSDPNRYWGHSRAKLTPTEGWQKPAFPFGSRATSCPCCSTVSKRRLCSGKPPAGVNRK